MKTRSIGMMIFLNIFTLGFFGLYWFTSFQNQLKKQTGRGFGGAIHLLLALTVVYGIVWQYLAGRRLAIMGAQDNSTMYLIMGICMLGGFNQYPMQNQANQLQDRP